MSLSNRSSAATAFQMPENFSFGLEERSPTLKAIKLELDDSSDCDHDWYKRDAISQTLKNEGKTILECGACKRTLAVYDWKLETWSD